MRRLAFAVLLALGLAVPAGAAMPTFVSCGTPNSSTAGVIPNMPASLATDDVLLLFVETADQASTISVQNGGNWVQVTNSPAIATGTTRLTVFWDRYAGQGAPTIADSGDHQLAAMCAYRGVRTTGNPWNITSATGETADDTSGALTGATTTVDNCLVVLVTAYDDDGDAPATGVTNADLTSISGARASGTTGSGNDGGLNVFDGQRVSAGSYGTSTFTYTLATTKGMMSIALEGAAGGAAGPPKGMLPLLGAGG